MLMVSIPRAIRFLIAALSMKFRVVGPLAKVARTIPVNRPQDMKYTGMGKVVEVKPYEVWAQTAPPNACRRQSFSGDSRATVVIGDPSTRFPLDLKKGDRIKVIIQFV